jgi:hypothetical protein
MKTRMTGPEFQSVYGSRYLVPASNSPLHSEQAYVHVGIGVTFFMSKAKEPDSI